MVTAEHTSRGRRPLRIQPLWVRVDENRVKLAFFVVAFVGGSAVMLTAAMVALPGWLLGWGADKVGLVSWDDWFARYPWVVAGTFALLVMVGAFMSAVQLANAHDWVKNRFKARDLAEGEMPGLRSVVDDMSIAAGLPSKPRIMLLEVASVNACAIGTTRKQPIIGVTRGLLKALSADEQRAVIATLIARIAAGDILFGTALAALMGPIKAIRGSGKVAGAGAGCLAEGCTNPGCSAADLNGCQGCGDGCSGCADIGDLGDLGDAGGGCAAFIVVAAFLAVVAAVTYAAVLTSAWIVTIWGRALHRTTYEKADAEGMLLLKDPAPMLSALDKSIRARTEIGDGDPSYDSIFYAPTSGTRAVTKVEQRRFDRLREVLGTDGLAAETPGTEEVVPVGEDLGEQGVPAVDPDRSDEQRPEPAPPA